MEEFGCISSKKGRKYSTPFPEVASSLHQRVVEAISQEQEVQPACIVVHLNAFQHCSCAERQSLWNLLAGEQLSFIFHLNQGKHVHI